MMRASTSWHSTLLDGLTVLWIDGSEGTGARICSVSDPERRAQRLPARRIVPTGDATSSAGRWTSWREEPLNGEGPGLTVYGSYKWDRPTFPDFPRVAPEYAHLAEGLMEGRGITDGTAAALLGARGGAAGKGKAKRRATSFGVTTAAQAGAAGTGGAKRRSPEHYREMALRSAEARRKKMRNLALTPLTFPISGTTLGS